MKNNNSIVKYQVEIDPFKLELNIDMVIEGNIAKGDILIEIPSWVPGDYSFKSYARDIFSLSATNKDNNETLEISRKGFNAFIINNGQGNICLSYKASAYATEFGEATGILDSEYAVLLGTRYLHLPDHIGECQVEYNNLPEGWKTHHPSGALKLQKPNAWQYPSYEILLDTPVSFGHFNLLKRSVNKTDFFFVFVDKGVGFDSEVNRFVDILKDVAQQMADIFGDFPFDDYTFIMSLNPAAEWGLEHLTSTMCGLGPEVFVDPDQFAIGIRVCAHELFHAWNVRRLRPEPLNDLQYNLSKGSFTEGLWLAEGFTRYYEFLITTRTKTYSSDQFFSAIVGYYQHLSIQPAYQRVSAIDSSLATYLNHSKYAGRVNNSIDYYDKGMLIAFEIDSILRTQTADKTLDKAFNQFYHKYVHPNELYAGYNMQDVVDFFNNIHPNLGDRIHNLMSKPGQLDTLNQISNLGFKLNYKNVDYLGLVFLNDSEPKIYNVLDNGPASSTGIAPDDVITHIDGYEYTFSALKWAASQKNTITLTVQRGQRRLDFDIKPKQRKKLNHLIWEGSQKQKHLISQWLHIKDFNPHKGQVFDLSFYENFHGLETVM